MLIRNSISTTKKFFQKTINTFKSLFSGDSYERLPKSSPYNTYQHPYTNIPDMNNKDLDKLYTDFTDRWDQEKEKKKNKKKITSSPNKQALENQSYQIQRRESLNCKYSRRLRVNRSKYAEEQSRRDHERRSMMVAEKLKEIEMMDISNVDHVLDIEEILHYYSRLTCPAYLDIVEKFFMDMHAEIFGSVPVSTPPSVNSRSIRVSSLRS